MCSVAWLPSLSLMGCMCVLHYPLFSGPGSLSRLMKRSLREAGCVGLQEEGEELGDLEPVIYRLPGMSYCFFLSVLIPACIPTYCPTTQHTSRCWPRPSLAAHVNRVS